MDLQKPEIPVSGILANFAKQYFRTTIRPELLHSMSIDAGHKLRHLREALGLTLRDVETGSSEIAARHGNQEFFIPFSRLSEIETKGTLPSIYRIYTLAAIYQSDYRTLCSWYGVNLDSIAEDSNVT